MYMLLAQSVLQLRAPLSHSNMPQLIHDNVMQHCVNGTGGMVPSYFEIQVFIVC